MTPEKRRGNHEGSVYQEGARSGVPNGRWIAQVRVNGKKRRATATTEAKAKRKLRTLQNQIDDGRLVADRNLTPSQLFDDWSTKALPNRNVQQPTIEAHRWGMNILRSEIGGKRIRTLTPDQVEEAFQRQADRGLSQGSLIGIRSTLNQALRWAERRGLVVKNIAAIVEIPASARRPVAGRSMTADEARSFLAAAEGTWLEAMWTVMLHLGLRPGESTALSWNDIDFEKHIVHVTRGRKIIKGRIEIGSTRRRAPSGRLTHRPS